MPLTCDWPIARLSKRIRLVDLWGNTNKWMVWWYCGLYKNERENSQPHALVMFREVLPTGELSDKPIFKRVLAECLENLVVGSIWEEGECHLCALYEVETFEVDFSNAHWQFTSFFDAANRRDSAPFPKELYPLAFDRDQNELISFNLLSGGRLIVPCLEFLTRCYGRSSEVKRVLMTYPWDGTADSVVRRIYAPLGEPEETGKWKLKLRRGFAKGDATFLAHVKYDPIARRAAKRIHAEIEAKRDLNGVKPAFIQVGPWHSGPAKLKVSGLWFNNRRSFLALRIIGCTDPKGAPINRLVDQSRPGTSGFDELDGGGTGPLPRRVIKHTPEIIDITSQYAPDHRAGVIELLESEYQTLGTPRQIFNQYRRVEGPESSRPPQEHDADQFGTGDASGADKGVGRARLLTSVALESRGTLRDMWNAALHFSQVRPRVIRSVEWYTFKNGFEQGLEPKLIALEPFTEAEEIMGSVDPRFESWWPYLNTSTGEVRGALIMRIQVRSRNLYIMEIQRRTRQKRGGEGKTSPSEENFQGLVFRLDDETSLEAWLTKALDKIRFVRGVMSNLTGLCPGRALTFNHRPVVGEQIPCEAAFRNALKKVREIL